MQAPACKKLPVNQAAFNFHIKITNCLKYTPLAYLYLSLLHYAGNRKKENAYIRCISQPAALQLPGP